MSLDLLYMSVDFGDTLSPAACAMQSQIGVSGIHHPSALRRSTIANRLAYNSLQEYCGIGTPVALFDPGGTQIPCHASQSQAIYWRGLRIRNADLHHRPQPVAAAEPDSRAVLPYRCRHRVGPQSKPPHDHWHHVGELSLHPDRHRGAGFSLHADYRVYWQPDSVSVEIQDEAKTLSGSLQYRRHGSFGGGFLLHLSRTHGGHARRH